MQRLLYAVMLLAMAGPAWGFSDNPRAASADSLISGAVRVHGTLQGDEVQCAGTCGFLSHRLFPMEATTGVVQIYLNRYSPDLIPGNSLCDQVCLGVVKPGQLVSNVDLTACSLTTVTAVTTQNQLIRSNFLGVTPRQADGLGTACGLCPGANCCAGGELYIEVNRLGVCPGGVTPTSNNINYTSSTQIFQ